MSGSRPLACPSAQPDMEDAHAFGVILGTPDAPRVAYLERTLPLPDVLGAIGEVPPTMVLRIAGNCETSRCAHYSGSCCTLAERCDEQLEPVVSFLPRCAIRSRCRWFAERGGSICHRCPQVVTLNGPATIDATMQQVATPPGNAAATQLADPPPG